MARCIFTPQKAVYAMNFGPSSLSIRAVSVLAPDSCTPYVVRMSYMMAAAEVFHSMENFFAIFPCYGKIFSTLWKKRPDFSTHCGKLGFKAVFGGFRAVLRGCGAEHAAPLEHRRARRPRGREKRCPTKAGSALNRSRLGCGVGGGRFFWPRGRGSSRSQMRWGRCGRARIYSGGC